MPRGHLADHLAGGDVEGGVEVGGAVADVVVAAPLRHPRHQRQHRRRPVERLDLRLLVHAQHDRRLRRVEVEPDDVAHLVDELRIGRELERLRLMRLQPERAPDTADRALAHPGCRRHRPGRPVRRIDRLLLERLHDHPLDRLVADQARLARPRLVMQTIDPALGEPDSPFADRVGVTPKLRGDLIARAPLRRRQHHPAAKRQRLRALRPPSPPLEHRPLLIVQHDLSPLRHARPPIVVDEHDVSTPNNRSLRTSDSGH